MAPGENFKSKAWGRIGRRQLTLDKLSTRIDKLLSYPRIAPLGGTIIEAKLTLQAVASK